MSAVRNQVVAATTAILILTTGCSSPSEDEANASIGVGGRTDEMAAVGVAVVTNDEGVAIVVGSLSNLTDRDDALLRARANAESGPVRAILPRGRVPVPGDESVQLSPRKGVMLVSEDIREGFIIELTFDFARSPDINLEVPVEPATGPYSDIEILKPPDGDIAPPDEPQS